MSILGAVKNVLEPLEQRMARRPDGELLRIHPYRKMLSFIMPGRNESVVYYEDLARAEPILDYIARARAHFGMEVDLTHCLVAAGAAGLHAVPEMNRFVVGKRLYQRNEVSVTFSMKRKRLDKKAKLSAVKLKFEAGETFEATCRRMNEHVVVERSGEKTYSDKEVDLLSVLPRPALSAMMATVRVADYYNVLPEAFIRNDAFYTSMFIANLGSLGMNAGFHHLYEWGNCPLFMMVGRIEERALAIDGKLEAAKVLPIHWSYDERIDDALTSFDGIRHVRACLERPDELFGKLPPLGGK